MNKCLRCICCQCSGGCIYVGLIFCFILYCFTLEYQNASFVTQNEPLPECMSNERPEVSLAK